MSLSQCPPVPCARIVSLLLPHLAGTVIESAAAEGGKVVLLVRPAAAEAACPGCGTLSGRVHGRYRRRLHDVPAGGRDVPQPPRVAAVHPGRQLAAPRARRLRRRRPDQQPDPPPVRGAALDHHPGQVGQQQAEDLKIGRASCRERV